jgi:hypothetical protein
MYGLYGHPVQSATIASGTSISTAIPITGFTVVSLELPLYASGLVSATANVYVQASDTQTGTYRRVQMSGAYSAGVGIADWEVPSGTGNRLVVCDPATAFNWLKIETSL